MQALKSQSSLLNSAEHLSGRQLKQTSSPTTEEHLKSFASRIAGDRLAFVGIGGGSDCIQASVLALLSGKPSCVISVRADKTTSQSPTGKIGEKRTVENHGGQIYPGVYRVNTATTGAGRFLEHIPASKLATYLVIDKNDGQLTKQILSAENDFKNVESTVAVDTGGDSLYCTSVSDTTKATPDQDIASLRAIGKLENTKKYSVIVAPGIDSPNYAAEILKSASAQYIAFPEQDKKTILKTYEDLEMDGSNANRYGKTAFAWQAALRGERGMTELPIPKHLVNDKKNPWNPNVDITDEMSGAYIMDLHQHLAAIQSSPEHLNEAII